MNLSDYQLELDRLHHPEMSVIEEGLKGCWELRPDVQSRVLTAKEMAEYMLWMAENFGHNEGNDLGEIPLPPMLRGGEIASLGQSLLSGGGNRENRAKLSALVQSSAESSFFLEAQDISAGVFLRYLPAYWRTDDYFELYYVYAGTSPVYFEKEQITLQPGSVLLIPPGTKKACSCPSDDCCVHFCLIRKSTFAQVFWSHLTEQNLMSRFFRQALSGEGGVQYLRFETDRDVKIEALMLSLLREYGKGGKYSSPLLNSLMSSFFLVLLQEHEDTARISKHGFFRWKPEYAVLLTELEARFADASLEELAAKFGYSRRQVIRIIQDCTGESFTQLQTRLRMEKAARMLKAGAASVEDIAWDVGFSDRTSFYRAFKKHFGCTPKAYCQRRSLD